MNKDLYIELLEKEVLENRKEINTLKIQVKLHAKEAQMVRRQGGAKSLFGDDGMEKGLTDLTMAGAETPECVPPRNLGDPSAPDEDATV
jgi:hypothetical protein